MYRRLGSRFPWGTLVVNLSGSFALGVLLPALTAATAEAPLHALLGIGFLGAFTTFSTLAYEAVILAQLREWRRAVGSLLANLVLGLAAVSAGLAIGALTVG